MLVVPAPTFWLWSGDVGFIQQFQAPRDDLPGGVGFGQAQAGGLHGLEAFGLRQKLYYRISQKLTCKIFI